ncbi:LysR family transcriptional regulator [Dyella choica]|uniref:LysR family transcriptional regulator n=1 Tax=Dyella choica TaxID=1927959 RepID=A0A3S0RH95_9GAMM|nr:LysR family transcriptional regulator [Dyella choica]RUL69185.1 LysR family transcriptional regulator [Dyella choica]
MDRISDIETFVTVIEQGNLSAAARHLGRSLPSVSRSLAALEQSVGVELVRRTTHQTQATDEGRQFYQRVKQALALLGEAKQEAKAHRIAPSGLLRISAAVQLADDILPVIAAYMERYTKVEIDLALSDRFVDLVKGGFDLAIRAGEMLDSSLKARQFGTSRCVTYAAPAYLARNGRPEHPSDLADHPCIFRKGDRRAGHWRFVVDGAALEIKVAGRLHLDNAAASHAAVTQGLGIGWAPLWQIQGLVDAGAVEILLERFECRPVSLHVVWPATRHLPAKARLFIDMLSARGNAKSQVRLSTGKDPS